MSAAALAIVIPAFNEAARIGGTLDALATYLAATGVTAELLIIDDGSHDATAAIARAHAPAARVIRLPTNRGKGAAVRAGVAQATAARILLCDADLATPIDELPRFMAALDAGADIAVGSRHISGAAIDPRQPLRRRALGAVFRSVTRAALRLPAHDAMCGFKLFRQDAARWLFARSVIDDYAFDIEILYLARGRFRVAELPVRWRHVEGSRVRIGPAAWRAARDLARIAVRGR
jgi:dolichyl-phosphate beta-glucosyltransferase